MRTKAIVAGRIWLVVGLCLGVGGSAIGVLTYELKATSASYEDTLRNVQQQDAARGMQVTFKKQVQAWKDTLGNVQHAVAARATQVTLKDQVQECKDPLLRGSNPEGFAKYQ